MPDRVVSPASPMPCANCPWRISNQGKRHPHGWYTKKNLRRLWARLRRGENMTCHPTDPFNEIPEGARPVPEGARTIECAGHLILQQREFMRFQAIADQCVGDGQTALRRYREAHPRGMTREGLLSLADRAIFGGTPLGGNLMTRPNLDLPDIGHPDLAPWTGAEAGALRESLR